MSTVTVSPDQRPEGWSAGAAAHDEWFVPLSSRFAINALRLLRLEPGQRLLDVAAGTGALTLAAAEAGVNVCAVDFAPGMVRLLRWRLSGAGLHARVAEILGRVDAVLPAWQCAARRRDGDALADDLAELHARLEEHLDEEEQHVLPIVGRTITATEWDELAERGFAEMPKRRALVFLGHILESASPAERSRFLGRRVPPPVRLLYRLTGRRAFTRETATLRAGLADPAHAARLRCPS